MNDKDSNDDDLGRLLLAMQEFFINATSNAQDWLHTNQQSIVAVNKSVKEVAAIMTELEHGRLAADRIRAACVDPDATLEDISRVIKAEHPVHPFAVMHLAMSQAEIETKIRETNSQNAKKKGEDWRQEAYRRYRKFSEQGRKAPSYAECGRRWEYKPLDDGTDKLFPSANEIARRLSDAKKEGLI